MRTFAGIEEEYAGFDQADILFQSIPYDGTSTWGKGADNALEAFLEAAENMEVYDIETNSEVYKRGVFMYPPLTGLTSPEVMFKKSYESAKNMLATNKFVTFFGGEHSISIGVIKAVYEKYPDITILQLDAHADLRDSYMGTPYNHAC
ncbi:MAG: arginase family protein, partial [Bacteroidales bacterium]